MKGLNIKSFKKVHDDEHKVIMRDPKDQSKEIVFHKKLLKHGHKKQLEALPMYAEGGDVKEKPEIEVEPIKKVEYEEVPFSASQQPRGAQAIPNAYKMEQESNTAKAHAVGQSAINQAKAVENWQKEDAKLPTQQDIVQTYKIKDQALIQKFQDGSINPERWWQNHSKVSAGIGILLGSLGQLFAGGENQALQYIEKEVDKDIERQKEENNKNLTLWKLNREALSTDLEADLATRKQNLVGLQYEVAKQAALSKNQIELQNANILNAQIQQKIDGINLTQGILQPSDDNPDPATRIQLLTQDGPSQKRLADEIDAAKNTVNGAAGILAAFDEAAHEVRPFTAGKKTSLTAFVPGLHSAGQKALEARLAPTFINIEGTSRKSAVDSLNRSIQPNFGDDDATIQSKRKSLVDYLRSKSSASFPKSFGLDLEKFPMTRTTNIGEENGIGGSGIVGKPQVIKQNGHTYHLNPATGKYE